MKGRPQIHAERNAIIFASFCEVRKNQPNVSWNGAVRRVTLKLVPPLSYSTVKGIICQQSKKNQLLCD